MRKLRYGASPNILLRTYADFHYHTTVYDSGEKFCEAGILSSSFSQRDPCLDFLSAAQYF